MGDQKAAEEAAKQAVEKQRKEEEDEEATDQAAEETRTLLEAGTTCAFCQDAMNHTTQVLEALYCGHTFHQICINDYCTAMAKSKATACPYKCNAIQSEADLIAASLTNASPSRGNARAWAAGMLGPRQSTQVENDILE